MFTVRHLRVQFRNVFAAFIIVISVIGGSAAFGVGPAIDDALAGFCYPEITSVNVNRNQTYTSGAGRGSCNQPYDYHVLTVALRQENGFEPDTDYAVAQDPGYQQIYTASTSGNTCKQRWLEVRINGSTARSARYDPSLC